MSLLYTAKKKAAHGSVKEAFKNEAGAVDLASIMVGVIVVGLIGGVIAATVFAVIPWAQDNGAKIQLDSVVTAQEAKAGLNGGTYSTDLDGFIDLTQAKVGVKSNDSDCYAAFISSPTGKVFYVHSQNTTPTLVANPWPSAKPAGYPANCEWPSNKTAAVSVGKNLVLNPSVETNLDSTSNIGNATKSLNRVASTSAFDGGYVMQINRTSGTNGLGYGVMTGNVEPGKYIASVRVRSTTPGMSARIYVEGSSTRTGGTNNGVVNIAGSDWKVLWTELTVTAGGTVKPGFLQTSTAVSTDSVEMDGIQLVKSTGDLQADLQYR